MAFDEVEKTLTFRLRPRVAAGGSLSRATDFNGSRERERESDVLLSGRSEGEGLREAGQTLRNPFAETFPEQEDGQSLPFELRLGP
ncbi:hypothetical protein AK812_SmicGene16727 [Symbiodinium microadriaticum]|uniref:Uncharacterized protein n=1 Tax=Symbiodinium microadriaticum TaxID=2951 RepID=A0A1Q9DZK8_SYMMI|nr:hypothetical protein AK812_SmicGene16727 [Symbiodinium microadriaticum]